MWRYTWKNNVAHRVVTEEKRIMFVDVPGSKLDDLMRLVRIATALTEQLREDVIRPWTILIPLSPRWERHANGAVAQGESLRSATCDNQQGTDPPCPRQFLDRCLL